MANNPLRAGRMELTIDGETYDAIGSFTLNLGADKREGLVGPDRVHGYKALPQIPSVKGEIRDGSIVQVTDKILNMADASIVIPVASGKTYSFEGAWYSGDGDIDTEDGKIQFEAQANSAEEILP